MRARPDRGPRSLITAARRAVTVRTVEIPEDEAAARIALLDLLPDTDTLAWVRDGEGLVGWGEAARAEFRGTERFSRAQRWWMQWLSGAHITDAVEVLGSGPIAFGSFAFDSRPGTSVVVVPQVLVGRRQGRTWLTTVEAGTARPLTPRGRPDRQQPRGEAAVEYPTLQPPAPAPERIVWQDAGELEAEWGRAVERTIRRIESGEVDKVVLARDLTGTADGGIDPRYVMAQLSLDYPDCWTFSVAGLVGATPELLVRRAGSEVTSRVLAGTVRRSAGDAGDAEAAALLASDKDLVEHEYAVQSVADVLASHCTDLRVPAHPEVLRLANVQHLATDVSGRLADEVPALALAASLHPTAAVCGTPTERAWEVIRGEETMHRGRYAGPVGWFDAHGDGEFGIALRCGELDPETGTARLFAGCGIVAGSTPEAEIAESQAKLAAMRSALQ